MKKINRRVVEAAVIFTLACSARADVTAAWNQNSDGNWSDTGKWAGGNAATGTTGVAYFTNAINASRTVTVDASPWTINGLTFVNTGSFGWTITGGTLELGGTTPTLTVNPGSAANVYSVLTGANGLTKAGSGTATLYGANTYSGPVAVDAGILVIEKGATLLNTSGAITVSPGACLEISYRWSGNPVVNALSLSGNGVGVRGALHFWGNAAISGPVTLAADSRITFENFCSMNGAITAAGAGKNLEFGQTTFNDHRYALTFTAGMNLGTGTLTLTSVPGGGTAPGVGYTEAFNVANTYSGGTVLTNYAILKLGHTGALGSGGLTIAPTATLDLNTRSITLPWVSGSGGTITDTGAAGTTTLTVTQSLDTTYSGVISNGASRVISLVKNGANTLTLSGRNSFSGATRVNAGKLVGATGGACLNSPVIVAGGATNGVKILVYGENWTCAGLTYTGGVAGLDFDLVQFPVGTAFAPLQINGDLNVTGTVDIVVRNGLWPATGTYPLVSYTGSLKGPGSFNLAGLPEGMSATLVSNTAAKRLDLNVTAIPAGSGPVSAWTRLVSGNASGDWGTGGNWSDGIPDGTDAVADFSTLDLTALSYVNNDAPRTVGTLRFADTAASHDWLVTNSTLTLAAGFGLPIITVSNRLANLATGLAGTQGFIKDGAGQLTLSGFLSNTFSGTVIASAGTLAIYKGASLKNTSGTIMVSPGACLDIEGTWDNNPVANAIYLSGTGCGGVQGALHFWENQWINGPVTLLTDSKITFQNQCAIYGAITAVGTGKNLEVGQPALASPWYSLEIRNSITLGTGVLTISSTPGGGSQNGFCVGLNAANTYSGGTVLTNYAVLRLGNSGALGSGGVSLCPNTRLDLYACSVTIPWLSGTGGMITDTNGAVGVTTLTVNQSTDTTYSGVINNGPVRSIALNKNGSGTLALSGTNTYTGATTVSGGTLCVDGSLATSSMTVGTGNVFSVAATGVVGRASLAGTLTFNNNSRLLMDVNPPSADAVSVSGNVVIGSNVELRLSGDQTRSGGSWKVVESVNGTVEGDFVLVGGVGRTKLEKIGNAVWLVIPPKGTLLRIF